MITNAATPLQIAGIFVGSLNTVVEAARSLAARQHVVEIDHAAPIVSVGLPSYNLYSLHSTVNPLFVLFEGLRIAGDAIEDEGVLIIDHPTPWHFHPVHHPSHLEFFSEVLSETSDPDTIKADHEKRFAEDDWYRHLFQTSHAYHGAHPLHLWYEISERRSHLGRVIIVGGDTGAVRQLGAKPASTFDDALEMARDVVGSAAPITQLHGPAFPTVHPK